MEEFRVLYENNYKKVCFYLKSICRDERLAEDLAQETFYNVLTLICSGKKLTEYWRVFICKRNLDGDHYQ